MSWIKSLLQSLNPKAWIVGAVKKLAILEIDRESDALVSRIQLAIDEKGVSEIDRIIDAAQGKLILAVNEVGPKWSWLVPFRDQAAQAVQQWGDDVQAKLDEQVKARGVNVVGLVLAEAKALLKARIAAL